MEKETGKFVRVGYDILDNKRFQELPHTAKVLYLYLRGSRGRKDGKGWVENVNFEHLKFGASDVKGIMSRGTYHKSIKELLAKGFVDQVTCGEFKNVKAVYALSDRWKSRDLSYHDSPF